MLVELADFEEQLPLLPQPVALAIGRIVRARYLPEQLDAIVKAAEVLTRYVAVATLASFACREDTQVTLPDLHLVGKNLSFGDFLSVIQATANVGGDHPLSTYIVTTFKGTKKHPRGSANDALTALLNFRNREGHDLRHLDEGKSRAVLKQLRPDERLSDAVKALRPLLDLPLVLIEQQEISGQHITARLLLLMGESEPTPRTHAIVDPVNDLRTPYLVHRNGLINLGAGLIWDFLDRREAFGLFLCDKISDHAVDFKSIADDTTVAGGPDAQSSIAGWLLGTARPAEPFHLIDGRSLIDLWRERRDRITAWRRLELSHSASPASADKQDGSSAADESGSKRDLSAEEIPLPAPENYTGMDSGELQETRTASDNHTGKVFGDVQETRPEPVLEKEFLEFELMDAPKRLADVAAMTGVSQAIVLRDLEFFGLEALASLQSSVTLSEADIDAYESGESIGVLARHFGHSYLSIANSLYRLGALLREEDLAAIGRRPHTVSRRFLESEFIEKKRTMQDIGNEVGLTRERVRQLLNQYNLPTRVVRSGDPADRLPEPTLRFLYEQRALTQVEIAESHGLRPREVADLVQRWNLRRRRNFEREGLTKEFLFQAYVQDRKSVLTIESEFGVPRQAISAALEHHGIPLRTRADAIGRGISDILTREYLSSALGEGKSVADIAADVGSTTTTVENYLVRTGLKEVRGLDPRFDESLGEERLRHAYCEEGSTIEKIARDVGAPKGEVRRRLGFFGVSRPKPERILPQPHLVRNFDSSALDSNIVLKLTKENLELWYDVEGRSSTEIAGKVECPVEAVWLALQNAGIPIRYYFGDVLSAPYLRRRYLDEGIAANQIAEEVGTNPRTVRQYLQEYGLPVRSRGEARIGRVDGQPIDSVLTRDFLYKECVDGGRSASSVAKELSIAPQAVTAALRRHGLPVKSASGGPGGAMPMASTLTREFLVSEYVDKGRSAGAIARDVGTTYQTVVRHLTRFGLRAPS